MELTVGTGRTASQVIDRREQQRAENGGHLIRPPIHPAKFTFARMERPTNGETLPFPNNEMNAMKLWLQTTFDAGGSVQDLRRCWETWVPSHRQAKAPLTDFFDQLCRRAEKRELELLGKASKENEAERQIELAKYRLASAEAKQREAVADLKTAQADMVKSKRELVDAEKALRERTQ